MKTDSTNLNLRLAKKLLGDFWECCNANDTSASQVVRESIRAYIELCARAKGKRLPRLDFCGFEEADQQKGVIFPLAPSLGRVAERKAIYRTGRIETTKDS